MSLASGDERLIPACERLELDQRIVEIRKEQERLAAPQRARDRDLLLIMVTFLTFQELGRIAATPPTTSSGRIRRWVCRRLFATGLAK